MKEHRNGRTRAPQQTMEAIGERDEMGLKRLLRYFLPKSDSSPGVPELGPK